MTSDEIRKRFLSFFEQRGHRVVPSASLVPVNDPTLLFTNAGMNQFKEVFLGREKRDYARACSVQKCLRVGGKHNDLEQVGRTTRHHTFFEMLGNFSFGDYFKKEAIPWAWELITGEFRLPRDKLYVTVFREDDEAEAIWMKIVPRERVFRRDEADNFWAMGETGPCGPCSEIHYDLGPSASDLGHKDCNFPCDCGRYVELWNLVFMQFNRDDQGKLSPLPRPSIDTGAGLERLATVLQGKISNFDTDLFRPLIEEAANLANTEYGANHDTDVSLRIVADHARAGTFLISDGVLPSNEGRGYVLRLILRRACYHGQTLGLNEPFLFKLSGSVVNRMKAAFPALAETAHHVAKAIKIEEERYAQTTRLGLEKLREALADVGSGHVVTVAAMMARFASQAQQTGQTRAAQALLGVVRGDDVFRLHDTFGLRPDFVEDVVKNYGLTVDRAGYEAEMQKQRERARASWKGAAKQLASPVYRELPRTEVVGYEQLTSDSNVLAIVKDGATVPELNPGEEGEVVLDVTGFYAEAGGQVGDVGVFKSRYGDLALADIIGCYQPIQGVRAHRVRARERIVVHDQIRAIVNGEVRAETMRNHTGTHLLHAALRKVLGTHVKQAGSLVAPDRLRFDFTHYAALDEQDLLDIEDLVNEHVLKNEDVVTNEMEIDKAIEFGAMALFGEKYGDRVRVVSITDFSKELCGGTHVRHTGEIGLLKVTSEGSVAAGTRRIEALTGAGVLERLRETSQTLALLSETLRAKPEELLEAAEKLTESEKKLRKQLEAQQARRAATEAQDLLEQAREVKGVRVIAAQVEAGDRATMRQMVDSLRAKLGSGVIVLGNVSNGEVAIVAGVTKDLTSRLDAGKIVREAAAIVGGSGGGRKDLAEAGGKNPEKLQESLQAVPGIIERML